MRYHTLKATCKTVHLGRFSCDLDPALVIDSGDRIQVETYTGFKLYNQAPNAFITPELLEICQSFTPRPTGWLRFSFVNRANLD